MQAFNSKRFKKLELKTNWGLLKKAECRESGKLVRVGSVGRVGRQRTSEK
ncbi:MAG: hypothetical protein AB4080_20410 [Trichodesmium sp.]